MALWSSIAMSVGAVACFSTVRILQAPQQYPMEIQADCVCTYKDTFFSSLLFCPGMACSIINELLSVSLYCFSHDCSLHLTKVLSYLNQHQVLVGSQQEICSGSYLHVHHAPSLNTWNEVKGRAATAYGTKEGFSFWMLLVLLLLPLCVWASTI